MSRQIASKITYKRRLIRALSPRWLRNWVRSPAKSLSYTRNKLQFALGQRERVHILNGFVPTCHPLSRGHFEVFCTDPVQSAELDAFIAHCTPGMTFVDIGAHHGFFALAAAHFGAPVSRILCVEASQGAAAILRENVAANNASDKVEVLNVAVGGENGDLRMLTTGPFGADYLVPAASDRRDAIAVKTQTLEGILSRWNILPTHIKLDVEGCEFEIIHSARNILRRLRPILFLELHGSRMAARGCDPSRVLADLKECGYSQFYQATGEVGDEPIIASDFNCRVVCQC
jgi:FkbM family methyltransferase